jgi:hypothetical protein
MYQSVILIRGQNVYSLLLDSDSSRQLELCNMEDVTRKDIADRLNELADEQRWNPQLWSRCYDLVGAHHDNELRRTFMMTHTLQRRVPFEESARVPGKI